VSALGYLVLLFMPLPRPACPFQQPTVTKSKICLILWSPEYSRVRSKMIYAASQEAVASKMPDVQRQLQATELEELEYGVIKNQVAK